MTERGLPIVDGAPACPFVAFADDRDERAAAPDHRHRCYAESQPAPRALAHQEAYCLSSAFPVCPTFQDWARREAARARDDAEEAANAAGAGADGQSQRNPPRNWAAPPPWLSRSGRGKASTDARSESLWAGGQDDPASEMEDDVAPAVPPQGRGLSGSYADRVAMDPDAAAMQQPAVERPPVASQAPVTPPASPAPTYHAPETWDDEPADADAPADAPPPRIRRRERDLPKAEPGRSDRGDGRRPGPAPEWERAKPLEAYPTIRSRRLSEISLPPILVAVVALALAAAVLFALPGLLGFGGPSAGGSPSPSTPIRTAIPSINPTPVPAPTVQIYLIQAGDTMSRIAGRFGIPLQTLIDANKDTVPDPNRLQIGQQVIIPPQSDVQASEIPSAT